MCGITGYVSRKPIDIERAKLMLPKMVNAIDHRGPDERGFQIRCLLKQIECQWLIPWR